MSPHPNHARVWLALALVVTSVGCAGSPAPAGCEDSACPTGQSCRDGICAAITPPTATGALGRHTSLALLPDGRRVAATYDSTYTNLVLLTETGPDEGAFTPHILAGWQVGEHALINTDAGRWADLVVDADGAVHLVWYEADSGSLWYAVTTDDASTLSTGPEPIDGVNAGDRGAWASLAVAADGTVHVAYRDATARRLRYAVRSATGTWTTHSVFGCAGEGDCPRAVDADGGGGEDYGEYASLALVAGLPRIAFYDAGRGDLKLASVDAEGAWSVNTLDGRDVEADLDSGDVGRFAAVAVDSKKRLGAALHLRERVGARAGRRR